MEVCSSVEPSDNTGPPFSSRMWCSGSMSLCFGVFLRRLLKKRFTVDRDRMLLEPAELSSSSTKCTSF